MQGNLSILKLKMLAGVAASLFIFATVLPAEVYQYTGVDYTYFSGPTYSSTESVNATFTLADPLAANDSSFTVTPTSWTITDGVNTLCDSCSGTSLGSVYFSTDSMGNITDWFFEATNTGSSVDVYSGGSGGLNTDSATTGGDSATAPIGTWEDTTATPEPGTFGMMLLTGSLLLFGTLRRRAGRSSGQA